jgi:hypothetical protein
VGCDDCLVHWNSCFQWKLSCNAGQKRKQIHTQRCVRRKIEDHSGSLSPLLWDSEVPENMPPTAIPLWSHSIYCINQEPREIVSSPKSHQSLNLSFPQLSCVQTLSKFLFMSPTGTVYVFVWKEKTKIFHVCQFFFFFFGQLLRKVHMRSNHVALCWFPVFN